MPVVSDSSKQQEVGEKEQNALKETATDRQTNQTSSTNAMQATNQCTSSDVETSSFEYRTGPTSHTSSTSEATHDSPSKEEKSRKSGGKKYKVRYEIKNYYQGLVLDLYFFIECNTWLCHGYTRYCERKRSLNLCIFDTRLLIWRWGCNVCYRFAVYESIRNWIERKGVSWEISGRI